MSGDLLQNVGDEFFLDACKFLPEAVNEKIARREERKVEEKKRPAVPQPVKQPLSVPQIIKTEFAKCREVTNADEIKSLEILVSEYGHHSEIWVSPYLSELRRQMSSLAEYERKALISSLAAAGAIKVEQRPADPHPFSVIILNWNHPNVQELNPG